MVRIDRIVQALESADLLLERRGELPRTVSSITDDSRTVSPGGLFVAVRGTVADGHAYLDIVHERGAAMAIVEDASRTTLPALVVRDGRRAAAVAARAAYDEPARDLRLVAVTGTNGKTTTVGMLRHLLDDPPGSAASIGTLGVLVGSEGGPLPGGSGLTTPGPVELQRVLRVLLDSGIRTVAMETSSHSLEQFRIEGVFFGAAVFTNFTRDHLDYHGTMEAYFAAKAKLLEHLASGGVAVVNADDPSWRALPVAGRRVSFGIESTDAHVRASGIAFGPRGSEWTLSAGDEKRAVRLPLIGGFNVANALGAAAAAWSMGVPLRTVASRLESLPQVPGRLEILAEHPTVLRDYAHTADALERALDAVRPFTEQRLIVVFGCGGDRDRGKRPLMGGVAERMADWIILTSDNPRNEDPERILDDIVAGMRGGKHERIEDRHLAIARALEIAQPSDVVLLAGKGHETYQVRGTTRHPFDERVIVSELMEHRRA
ncbi:MAG TPA: UDP-N-acetylmuramoyl-L-alanyl-D-glutamate--2,6-diaminopimelate ligase [Gemmatimonadaceae bacterium]|nr:UDP-N-acetylmuramoyl-L-alanyl-D-glutamate--2,6-diaminopimelate ligase [Gemmatimonadaceae bacterium]